MRLNYDSDDSRTVLNITSTTGHDMTQSCTRPNIPKDLELVEEDDDLLYKAEKLSVRPQFFGCMDLRRECKD